MSLIQKYNVPGPRYTSYPTVPFWKNDPLPENDWIKTIEHNLAHFKSNKTALYIHLPYCESMCTFCGCHKRITKNHAVEAPYIDALIQEWDLYEEQFIFEIDEIHLGGGTPTFFSINQLSRLISHITKEQNTKNRDTVFSFEAHPNFTSYEQLIGLYNLGFTRLSLGIQDYEPVVQQAIHRIQSFEQVAAIHNEAKKIGYTSVSHDLVYGLPKQELNGFMRTIDLTLKLRPERVSLYSYAHVPWIKGNGQRGFDENDLPDDEEKRALYDNAKIRFLDAGYIEVGMDHFALPDDDLAIASRTGELHRNFMGYTTQKTNLLIGLGASAISDSWFGFAQNEKSIEVYLQHLKNKRLPVVKGHLLSDEDLILRRNILELMCQFSTELPKNKPLRESIIQKLQPLIEDNLVVLDGMKVNIKEEGKAFVRNICMAFDSYLLNNVSVVPAAAPAVGMGRQEKQIFSKTI